MKAAACTVVLFLSLILSARTTPDSAELILQNGKIVTVDRKFTIRAAMAVKEGRILAAGSNKEVLAFRGPGTQVIDLQGKTVIPGLIDSHTHPTAAAMVEFEGEIPPMETIGDVLAYIRRRASEAKPGDWIAVRQVFITRLKEQRYPTRQELDEAAPRNPVLFATGPDASLNTQALKLSGIDRDFTISDGGPGKVEKSADGEPTGILRGMTRFVKVPPAGRLAAEADRKARLLQLFHDYLATGITAIGDRDGSVEEIERYRRMRARNEIPLRISVSQHVETIGSLETIQENIRRIGADPLHKPDPMLQIIGIKTYMDGGMLTGSAYMRKPWGVSKIYSITDPEYRGTRFIPHERLVPMIRTAVESGLQFTAHSVGDGAVHAMIEGYEEVNRSLPIRATRPCITHSNFMSEEDVKALPRLGVSVDIQPAWLYLDTRTLTAQFGYDRMRWFQPLRTIFKTGGIAGGGSDHMQKIGSLRSVNPYNPYLGMWTAITRQAKGYDGRLHPEEALTREQALRFYTVNNAYILFRDKDIGSLEKGKWADFVILDRDLLTCPVDQIKEIRPLQTFVSGKPAFSRDQ